jgi:hypothetical protein
MHRFRGAPQRDWAASAFHREILLKQNLSEGNVSSQAELAYAAGGSAADQSRRLKMIKLVLRRVTLGMFLVVLIAAPSFTPAFAMGGGGGGGGAGGGGGGGTGGAGIPLMYFTPSGPPSSYPGRSGIKSPHKIKKTIKQSGIGRPGV